MDHRCRAFTFTINNDTYIDLDELMALDFIFMCFGFEVGEESHIPHIQGFVLFQNATTIRALSKRLRRAHLEVALGSVKQNEDYTSKQGDWYEFGTRAHQGKAKWDLIEESQRDPMSNPHLFQQYHKMYRMLTLSKPKDHERKLVLIPEPSRYLIAKYLEEQGRSLTFDYSMETYDGEDAVIIPCYGDKFVMDWINGYPSKMKRGYELICLDPEIVYIMFENTKEERYLKKKYLDYIDAISS